MDRHHATSDEQSLRLTQAAVRNLQAEPTLVQAVLGTLDHWDRVAPVQSKQLRDQWRRIVQAQDWQAALDPSALEQQLRQASPLGRAISSAQRLNIIRQCKGRNSNT
jgi:hypothetical protein